MIYIFHRSSYIGSGGGDEGELLGHHGPPPEQSSYLNDNDIAEEAPRQEEITTLNAEQYSDIENVDNEPLHEQQNNGRNLIRRRNQTSLEHQIIISEEVESLLPTLSPTTQLHKHTLYEIQPKPNGWEDNTMGFYDIRHYLRCSHYTHNPDRPLPTEEYWDYLKAAYKTYVDSDLVFDDIVPSTIGYE